MENICNHGHLTKFSSKLSLFADVYIFRNKDIETSIVY